MKVTDKLLRAEISIAEAIGITAAESGVNAREAARTLAIDLLRYGNLDMASKLLSSHLREQKKTAKAMAGLASKAPRREWV